jgi:hypothetical protein
LVDFSATWVVNSSNNICHTKVFARNTRCQDIRVIAIAHSRKGIGSLYSCLNQNVSVKANTSEGYALEVWTKSAKGFTILVDDGNGMACLFEALGDQCSHSTAPHDNYVHASNLHLSHTPDAHPSRMKCHNPDILSKWPNLRGLFR